LRLLHLAEKVGLNVARLNARYSFLLIITF
jgi:hypothetical protein